MIIFRNIFLILSIVGCLQVEYQNEYEFINWFLEDKGDTVYLQRKSSQVYTQKVWNGRRNEALDYEHLSNIDLFPIYKENRKIATDYLSKSEIERMKEESYVGITFDQKRLHKNIRLIRPSEYNLYEPDSTTGFWVLGRPLFNDDKTICLIYVSEIYSTLSINSRIMIFKKEDDGWNYLMEYVGWLH